MSLRRGLDRLQVNVLLPETEETWDRIANGINGLRDLCHNGTASDSPQEFVSAMKGLSRPLTSALNSERTRLSGPAIELIAAAASELGSEFEPLLPMFFPPLLSLCSRTNKVVLARAKACVLTIIQSTQSPSVLPHLVYHAKDKGSTLRLVVAEGTLACLTCFNPPDLEKEARAKDVESIIRTTAKDAAAEVRRASRDIFDAYKLVLPGRVASFAAPLSPTIKKYLDIKLACSGTGTTIHRPHSSLAASTSSLRSNQTTVAAPPERPKSSSSSVKDDATIVSKSIIRPRRAAVSPPAIFATQTQREEARRDPVFQSQTNVDMHRPTPSASVKATVTNGAECHLFTSQTSSGPKRILLPNVPNAAQGQLQTGNQSDSCTKSMPSRKPVTTSGVVEKEKSRNPSRAQTTAQISAKQNSEAKKAPQAKKAPPRSGVSQPTKSQLAKVVAAKSKPAAPAKAPKSRAISKSTTIPKKIGVCSAAQVPLPPSRSSTPTNVVKPADIVKQPKQPKQLDSDDNKLFTMVKPDTETPKKEGTVDDVLAAKTPITALLTSIEQGFLHSPFSPLSPPQSYLYREADAVVDVAPFPLRLPKKEGLGIEPHKHDGQSIN